MPNWKKLLVSGADASINQLTLGSSGNTYSFPTQSGNQLEVLVAQSDGDLQFGSIGAVLDDGILSSSQQIVDYNEFARIRGGNTFSGSQTFQAANVHFQADPNAPNGELGSFLTVTGSIIVTGFIGSEGGLTIGNNLPDDIGEPDTVSFKAFLSSSIIPITGSNNVDNGLTLGAPDRRWTNIYARHLNTSGSLVHTGSLSVIGNIDSVGRIDTDDSMRSVFVGRNAGLNEQPGYFYNTGIGYTTLGQVTDGLRNAGLGFQSVGFVTTGDDNIGIGYFAGLGVTTGQRNVYIGTEAGGTFSSGGGRSENTAVGYYSQQAATSAGNNSTFGSLSGTSITTGGHNTLVGWRAGAALTTGISNVAIGSNAAYQNMNGSSNIVIGFNTGVSASGDSHSIIIGAGTVGRGANTTTIGNTNTTSTKLYGTLEIDGILNVSQSIAAIEGGNVTLPAGIISSSAQIDNLFDIDGIVSSSTQVINHLPANTVSSSTQTTANLPANTVSGSAQIDYTGVTNIPSGIVSSSAQIDGLFNLDDIVSSSAQISALGFVSQSTRVISSSNQIATAISGAFTEASGGFATMTTNNSQSIANILNGSVVSVSASNAATASHLNGNISALEFANSQDYQVGLFDNPGAGSNHRELGLASGSFLTVNPATRTLSTDIISSSGISLSGDLNINQPQTTDFSANTLDGGITASNMLIKNNFTTLGVFTADNLEATASKASQLGTSSYDPSLAVDVPVLFGIDSSGDGFVNVVTHESAFKYNGARLLMPAFSSSGDGHIDGDLNVTGNINASTIHTTYVTSSFAFYSSSNKFGDEQSDQHDFTGSLNVSNNIILGDENVSITATGLTVDSANDARITLDRASTSQDAEVVFTTNGSENWSVGTGQVGGDSEFTIRESGASNVFRLTGNRLQLNTQLNANAVSASTFVSSSNLYVANTGSIAWLNIMDQVQLNGPGSQYFAYNEDTVKVKFANWYSSNANQFGQTQLWHELAFLSINSTDHRRISFYLDTPDSGSTDSVSGVHAAHASNAGMFLNHDGLYVTNNLVVTGSIVGDGSGITGVSADSVTFANVTNRPTLLSSSNQIGTAISGAFDSLSGSIATRFDGLTSDYTELTNIPSGIISSSAQIDNLFDIDGIVSSSTQVVSHLPDGTISSSAQIADNIDTVPTGSSLHGSQVRINATGSHGIGTVRVESGGGFHLSVADSNAIRIGDTTTNNSSIAINGSGGIHLNTAGNASAEILLSAAAITDGTDAIPNILAVGTDGRIQTSNIQIPASSLPGDLVSSSAQIDALGFISASTAVVSSSAQIDFTQITNTSGIVSSSTQVVNHLPGNIVSSSAQVTNFLPAGTISGSAQIDDIINIDGIVSSSTQFSDITAPFTGSFTGSFIGDGSGLTGVGSVQNGILFGLGLLGGTYTGLLSVTSSLNTSSAHFEEGAAAAIGSSSFASRLDTFEGKSLVSSSSQVEFATISNKPEGLLSSSAQIDDLFNLDGIVSSSDQIASAISGAFDLVSESLASDIAGNFDNGLVTASANLNVITFTEGNTNTFDVTINTGSLPNGLVSASAAGTSQGQIALNGTDVSVNGLGTTNSPTFQNLTVSGNLTTLGTVTNINSTDLSIEDKFMLLNSGSSSGDSGIVVQTGGTNGVGTALFYDSSETRWGLDAAGANANTDVVTADAHLAAVAVSDTDTNYQQEGNIYVSGQDVFIWVD